MKALVLYFPSVLRQFRTYKELGDKTFAQINDSEINFCPKEDSNSIAIIVKHMHGNMLSRWTDFLTTDGEKENRHRDQEFEGTIPDKAAMLVLWEEGWARMFSAIENLKEDDLGKTIYIRKEPHTVLDAMTRQLAHYAFHVGQIVYLGKVIRGAEWNSLSIPRGKSEEFNKNMEKR